MRKNIDGKNEDWQPQCHGWLAEQRVLTKRTATEVLHCLMAWALTGL